MFLSDVSQRDMDDLELDLISHAQRMNIFEYEFLELVLEFDIRQGWKAYHFNNCAEWLNMRCGIQVSTGREKVRVARALFDLPLTSEGLATGQLSYSKVRALTRVATVDNEASLLEKAIPATASQVDDYCQKLRNANRSLSTQDVNRIQKNRYLSCSHHADGSSTISVELTRESAELIMKAVEIAASDIEKQGQSTETSDSYFARQADALETMARSYLAGGGDRKTSTADHYQVVVHVDEKTLRGDKDESGKSDLPIESVRRLTCDASLIELVEDEQGNPLNLGRKRRVVSPKLRRALLARDKCCRFPGCIHDKWLDAHHGKHWIDGGETDPSNTLLLCSRHHRLLHEGAFTIHKNFRDEWYFRNGNGMIIPEGPVYIPAEPDDDCIEEPNPSRDGFVRNMINPRLPD